MSYPDSHGPAPAPGNPAGEHSGLADFVLSFTKAILKTGYYEHEHPEAQKARAGLYYQLNNVLDASDCLTVSVVQAGNKHTVLIGGLFDEPVDLLAILKFGGAELFIPKILDLMLGKGIFSLSIQKGIDECEFLQLIDLMSRPSPGESLDDEGSAFAKSLEDLGVRFVHVVPVHELRRFKRRLPWRVKILLSRIARDLRKVPLVRDYSREQITGLYLQVIEELLRSIREPALIKDVILNLDIIRGDVEDLAHLDPVEAVAKAMPAAHLPTVLSLLVALKKSPILQAGADLLPEQLEIVNQAIMIVIDRLVAADNPAAYPILEEMFKARVIPFDRLPAKPKMWIMGESLREKYLSGREEYLENLRECIEAQAVCANLMDYFIIADCFIRKGQPAEAWLILSELFRLRDSLPAGDASSRKNFEDGCSLITTGENLEFLKPLLKSEAKDERLAAVEIAGLFGTTASGTLIDVLRDTTDTRVHKAALQNLIRQEKGGLPAALEALGNPDESWSVKKDMLNYVAEVGDSTHADAVTASLTHEHPRVREAALEALFLLKGDLSENRLLGALHDSDEMVRRKAISLLLSLGSVSPRFLDFLKKVLAEVGAGGDQASDGMQLAAAEAMCDILRDRETDEDIERRLLDALGVNTGLLGLVLSRIKTQKCDAVRIAIIRGLGRNGTERSEKALEVLSNDASPAVAKEASAALADLKKRL